MKVLVTGATGYVGGRLIPRLLEKGHTVRAMARNPDRLAGRAWADRVEIVRADLLSDVNVAAACAGMDAAYYLVHSMHGEGDFSEADRTAAENFARAAQGIGKVIYLGGLVPSGDDVSAHLRSRGEVGEILRRELPVTEFRAGPLIGSGSSSFEMVRYLTERLPAMVAPRWINNAIQPIAIRDALAYLIGALDREPLGVVDIGADVLTFKEMMQDYAASRGYRRWIVPVPLLAPKLAGLWVGLVTPIPNRLAVPLIQGIIHPICGDLTVARREFPKIEPLPYRRALELALEKIRRGEIETSWSGALGEGPDYELTDWEGLITEVRRIQINRPPADVFAAFTSLGGAQGWLAWNWAWRIRGLVDRLVGGPGLRRGRRHPHELWAGEAVDFWRVERVERDHLVRLRAEMRVPGKAWLQWEALPDGSGTMLIQTAAFAPEGLGGSLYWYALYPIHRLIFSDLARAVKRFAESHEVKER